MTTTLPRVRAGLPLGLLAVAFMALFLVGLVLGIVLAGGTPFPSPFGAADAITAYFRDQQTAVRVGAFLQFVAVVPLSLYTTAVAARLRGPGASVALAGGLVASVFLACSALVSWVLSRPEVATEPVLVRALQDLAFITGGPGHIAPLGLLVGGIALGARRLPRWLVTVGLVIGVVAVLSTLTLLFPEAAYLLPIARFTGLIWLVAAGFLLPRNDIRDGENS